MNITIKDGRAYNDKGEVGVLISVGHGAGWSTWSNDIDPFDPYMIEAVVKSPDKVLAVAEKRYPEAYHGGLERNQMEVVWLTKGTKFYIDEYDGAESLVTLSDLVMEA